MSDPVDWERGKPELYPAHGQLQARVAELIALRTARAALQRDEIDFFHYHPNFDDGNGERVFAYCRTGGALRGAAGQVVVVANCGPADYSGGYQLQWSWLVARRRPGARHTVAGRGSGHSGRGQSDRPTPAIRRPSVQSLVSMDGRAFPLVSRCMQPRRN
jgi:hypothetical protein